MDWKRLCIFEYEELISGKIDKLSVSLQKNYLQQTLNKHLGYIWYYALHDLRGWSAEDAKNNLTYSIIDEMKLKDTLNYIGYDLTKVYRSNFDFILQYAYPDEIKYSLINETILEYQKTVELKRYPKHFFNYYDGEFRAKILLKYVISVYLKDKTIDELADFFYSKKSVKWLQNHYLYKPMKLYYYDPFEYLFWILPDNAKEKYRNRLKNY